MRDCYPVKDWTEGAKRHFFPDSAVRVLLCDSPVLTDSIFDTNRYDTAEFSFAQMASMNWIIVYEGNAPE